MYLISTSDSMNVCACVYVCASHAHVCVCVCVLCLHHLNTLLTCACMQAGQARSVKMEGKNSEQQ